MECIEMMRGIPRAKQRAAISRYYAQIKFLLAWLKVDIAKNMQNPEVVQVGLLQPVSGAAYGYMNASLGPSMAGMLVSSVTWRARRERAQSEQFSKMSGILFG
jgi:hypothetical protein